jgi:hypothetical protein
MNKKNWIGKFSEPGCANDVISLGMNRTVRSYFDCSILAAGGRCLIVPRSGYRFIQITKLRSGSSASGTG